MSVLASLRDRVIEPDDQAFIETMMQNTHQEVYWQGWVLLYTKSNAAAKKERILVVTNFRVFTVKQGLMQRSTRQSFPVLDLHEMVLTKDADPTLHLEFSNKESSDPFRHTMDVQSENIKEIAQAVLFAFKSVAYNRPPALLPKIELPANIMDGFLKPEPDTQDGLLAAYCAACDYYEIPQKLPVLDYFMTAFEQQNRTFDLGLCLDKVDKALPQDIRAIANALMYTHWFNEFLCIDYAIKDEGLEFIAPVFSASGNFTKLVLVNTKAGKSGFARLSQHLEVGTHGLNHLNVSKNALGDGGVKALADALEKSKKVLQTLCVASCQFSNKGFEALRSVLASSPQWRSGLKVLDVSDNSAGKSGTQALCEWVKESTGVEQIYAMHTDLHVDMFLEALLANGPLCHTVLQSLNLSGNKPNKQAILTLANVLCNSKTLNNLYLVDCGLSSRTFLDILTAALNNLHGVRYWLEFSKNDLGSKGGKEVAELVKKHAIRNIHALILNDNSLGAEGIIALCDAFSGSDIHTLSLDANVKVGFLSSNAKEAGEALAKLVSTTPKLRELSVAGDDSHYLKNNAFPLLTALKTNKTLEFLDVSRNRLGDDGVKVFADALATNRTLTSFDIGKNRFGMKGLRELHAALRDNTSVLDWPLPEVEIDSIYQSAGTKAVRDLRTFTYNFDQFMSRNQRLVEQHQHGSDAKTAAAAPVSSSAAGAGDDAKFADIPAPGSRKTSVQYDDTPMPGQRRESIRPLTYRKKMHNRQASDVFDKLARGEVPVGAAERDGDHDGDVDVDGDEPSAVKP